MSNSLFQTLENVVAVEDPAEAARYDTLRDNMAHIPGIMGLVLVSGDGMPQAGYGFERDDTERITAAVSGIASLSAGLIEGVRGGELLRTMIQMRKCTLLVTRCGTASSIAVAVDASAQIGLAMGEIERKAKAYAEQVSVAPRFPASR